MATMAQVQQDIELPDMRPQTEASSSPTTQEVTWEDASTAEIELPPLPPTDTGKAAWLVLAGSSLIQAPVWGMTSHSD